MNGILYKPEMINAIVENRKTVTRRLSGLKELNQEPDKWEFMRMINNGKAALFWVKADDPEPDDNKRSLVVKPRYHIGQTVYVKEAWRIINPIGEYIHNPYDFGIEYLSVNHETKWWTDNGNIMNYPIDEKIHSSMFLPEKFARTFLKIVDVRAERLQEITDDDVQKEGVFSDPVKWGDCCHVDAYIRLWDSINGKVKDPTYTLDDNSNRHYVKTVGEYCWVKNPWIWRYEFKKVETK
jgi:hypothetical protein